MKGEQQMANVNFVKLSADAFKSIQMDAGVLLKNFTPTTPAVADSDIICATTGGINASCVPTYSDWGEDIDNCPNNMIELKHIDGWECKMSFTALNVTADVIKIALGVTTGTASTGIKAKNKLGTADVTAIKAAPIWWVGNTMDGGFVAIKLSNPLSTSGFNLQTTKNGKGQLSVELTGNYSMDAQDDVPMEFYATVGTT